MSDSGRHLLFAEQRCETRSRYVNGRRTGAVCQFDAGTGSMVGDTYQYSTDLPPDIGCLLDDPGTGPELIEQFCRDLEPEIARHSQGSLTGAIEHIAVELRVIRRQVAVINGSNPPLTDTRVGVGLTVIATARAGTTRVRAVRRTGTNRLATPGFDLETATAKACVAARARLTARRLDPGHYPTLLAPGIGAIVLHEAVVHALEADMVLSGSSMFRDARPGQQVAPDHVTIVDSGIESGQLSSSAMDDEGIPTRSTTLIESGRLSSLLHSLSTARIMNAQPTGNGRRETFRHQTLPRATCTMLTGTGVRVTELLRSIKQGVYLVQIADGQCDVSGGPFQFMGLEAYAIEDGCIGDCVHPMLVTGLGREYLGSIAGLGNDFEYEAGGGGPCLKGQRVDVSFGQPTALVTDLNFAGPA